MSARERLLRGWKTWDYRQGERERSGSDPLDTPIKGFPFRRAFKFAINLVVEQFVCVSRSRSR